MIAAAAPEQEQAAPSSVPPNGPIDLDHLARMTMGDRGLEQEILALFDRQADRMLAQMAGAAPSAASSMAAHTLKGSARGIGAWQVAEAADAVERAEAAGFAEAIVVLAAAVSRAKSAIAGVLRSRESVLARARASR